MILPKALSDWHTSTYLRAFPVYKDHKSSQTNKTSENIVILTILYCGSSLNL